MFAQLIASRAPRPRTPAGFVTSIAVHGIIVAGAVLLTSREPTQRSHRTPLILTYVAPSVRPRPATQATSRGAVPLAAAPGIINVPLTVPDAIPPLDLLRTAINTDQPFEFRIGATTRAGTLVAADPGTAFLDSQVEVPVVLDPRSPVPGYPQLLKDAGIEGAARLRFVVDTLGRVEIGSVQVVEATHPAFAIAVQAVLPRMRFAPARVGERKVRQLVEFPLQFRLHR